MLGTEKIPISVLAVYVGDDFSLSRLPASQALTAKHRVIPLKLLTLSDETITIDRVISVCRMASTKAGGLGDRYSCLATMGDIQREILVYRDDIEWYMEANF